MILMSVPPTIPRERIPSRLFAFTRRSSFSIQIEYSNFFYKHDKLSHPYDHACAFTHHTYWSTKQHISYLLWFEDAWRSPLLIGTICALLIFAMLSLYRFFRRTSTCFLQYFAFFPEFSTCWQNHSPFCFQSLWNMTTMPNPDFFKLVNLHILFKSHKENCYFLSK